MDSEEQWLSARAALFPREHTEEPETIPVITVQLAPRETLLHTPTEGLGSIPSTLMETHSQTHLADKTPGRVKEERLTERR